MTKRSISIYIEISQTISMRKRFLFVTSVVLSALVLNGLTAEGSNFNTGALLNSQWTCLDARLSNSGPISEQKIAELEFAPTTVKKDKTFTTVTFTKFNLKSSKGLFTSVGLQVFNGKKTYKQSFIPLKPMDGTQKINFSVKVPTQEIKDIVFGISIQDPKNRKIGGACIPTSLYTSMLPSPKPTSTPTAFKGDLVLEKIRQMIPMLKTDKVSENKGTINWIVGPNVPAGYKEALEEQGNDLAKAFPELYKWEGTADIIIGDILNWPVNEIKISAQCKKFVDGIIIFWKDLPYLNSRLLGGASSCDGHPIVVIRPNPSAPQPDADLMAQEIGGEIQYNAVKRNPRTSTLSRGELVIPNWYLQGGQSANAFIAFAYKNKSLTRAIDKVVGNTECRNVSLNQMRPENKAGQAISNCDYIKGFVSVRLMIALYGWDAAEKWFSGFSSSRDYEDAFLVAYGQPLTKFEALADDYWNYLNGMAFSENLVAALKVAP
jgi:hypothetical protein